MSSSIHIILTIEPFLPIIKHIVAVPHISIPLNTMALEFGKVTNGRRSNAKISCFLLCCIMINSSANVNAFTLPSNNRLAISIVAPSPSPLFAKPPTRANYDIDAMEALEAERDHQEKLRNQSPDEQIEEPEEEDEWELLEDLGGLKEYTVSDEMNLQRIDAILSAMEPDMSRSLCGSLISDGKVAILTPESSAAGQKPTVTTRKSIKLETGTIMFVKHAVDETPTEILAQNLPLNILYEDECMIVLNKAAGMVVHPAVGNWDGTVVNALAYYLANESPFGSGDFIESDGKIKPDQAAGVDIDGTDGEVGVSFRPGIVHRLDKGTTGILVVAKTRESLTALSACFANRQVRKTYVAVTGK